LTPYAAFARRSSTRYTVARLTPNSSAKKNVEEHATDRVAWVVHRGAELKSYAEQA